MRIITIYQTEPDWCALVELSSGAKATLTFAAQPSDAEVEAVAAMMELPPETTLELEAEDGTIIE